MAQHPDTSLSGTLVPFLPAPIASAADRGADISSEIHEYHVPDAAAEALDRLYGSLYASCRHLQLCEPGAVHPHTWLGYRRGEIAGVLLFRIETDRVLVLTEMFRLDEALAVAFCRSLFARYPAPHAIVFNAIVMAAPPPLPCQHFAFSENYVLALPPSVDAYRAALGKSTRKTLRGYRNRLLRDYPRFEWRACSAAELPAQAQRALVAQLQAFKQESMAARGKQARIDAQDTARMLTMAAESGLFGLGTVDGRLCAGSLACRIGDNYVMLLSAADPALSDYRLGLLSCYWSICDCIQRAGRECHLLWGRYQYKEQLLARPQALHFLKIYRSRSRMLGDPAGVITMALRGGRYRLRHWWLNELPQRRDLLSRALAGGVACLRRWKEASRRSDELVRSKNFLSGIFQRICFHRT